MSILAGLAGEAGSRISLAALFEKVQGVMVKLYRVVKFTAAIWDPQPAPSPVCLMEAARRLECDGGLNCAEHDMAV